MARPKTAQLERSLEALTIGLVQDVRHRNRMLHDGQQGEFQQQMQVELSGTAGNVWAWQDQKLSFEYPFVYAPLQRQADLLVPHFTCGFTLAQTTNLILLHAHVIAWNVTEESWVIGATVRFAVSAPNAVVTPVPYDAQAHLTFHGYATYAEGSESLS